MSVYLIYKTVLKSSWTIQPLKIKNKTNTLKFFGVNLERRLGPKLPICFQWYIFFSVCSPVDAYMCSVLPVCCSFCDGHPLSAATTSFSTAL